MSHDKFISEPIAIVGSSCRFAGSATSPSKLWELLSNPTDLSRHIPGERFNYEGFYHPDGEYHGTTNAPKGYWLEQDHRVFDADFFSITPKEAEAIDPQQRLLLEVVYEALEAAGYTLPQYAGKNVAVFTGSMTADYDTVSSRDDLSTSQYFATGNARSILSNRISYFFNFRGPSMTIDTACSASLVALHQAVLSLRSGESEMACVTGVNLMLVPEQFVVESSLHMLSPTGKCHMWDDRADGYARGEGVAALFLKPLSKALADGDCIEAIIRESGVNSDGRTKGITMPGWETQSNLIQATYRRAGLDAKNPLDRPQFFECHGTGTQAGDPNEARAIDDAFFGGVTDTGASTQDPEGSVASMSLALQDHNHAEHQSKSKLLVGSIKTVIGHAEGAAGLAGVLKAVQAIRNSSVPPNLHFKKLNPAVEKYYSNLLIPTTPQPWPQVPAGQPKRVSVNSFGFGGTNAHAIIEEYKPDFHCLESNPLVPRLWTPQSPGTPKSIGLDSRPSINQVRLPLVLSASSQKSLVAVAKQYRSYLTANIHSADLEQLAWHTYARRTAFQYRATVSGLTVSDVIKNLDALVSQSESSSGDIVSYRTRPETEKPKILGVFTGQGAQWPTMSRGLLQTSEVYARTIRYLDKVLQSCPDPPSWTLEQEILADKHLSRVAKPAIAQPLCTALQVATVDLLRHLGIGFHTVIGHSSGEIGAAYAAGRLKARDAILIAFYRGHFSPHGATARGEGAMLAAGISKEEATDLLAKPEYRQAVCIAANNSTNSVTLSGDAEVVRQIHDDLTKQDKFARMLQVQTAYHSPHMEGPAAKYTEILSNLDISPSATNNGTIWVSSVYGHGEPDSEELISLYWKDNMVRPVLFYEAVVTALKSHQYDIAIEVGPHPTLKSLVTQTMKEELGDATPYSGVLSRNQDDRIAFADFLGWMWSRFSSSAPQIGKFVLGSVQPDLVGSHLEDIPSYPWDHSEMYYRESRIARQYHQRKDKPHELLGVRTRDDNEHELRWRNILKLETLPWVEGHKFQGHALLPASAYCVMAVDAARVMLGDREASIIELQDLKFPNGIMLEAGSVGVEVLFSLFLLPPTKKMQEAMFTVTSCPADGSTSMKMNCNGRIRAFLGKSDPHSLPSRPLTSAETLPASPTSFYKMMADLGLAYTPPFQGLTSLNRRFDFASGIAQKLDPTDTTGLSISPATLDSCLQTAFVTVSSPGDKALWTSFLPITIESVKFNMAICDIKNGEDKLVVDTFLTKAKGFTKGDPASFAAEINIFDEQGNKEIQIEGLTVGSFSSTRPDEDYELYLTTVTDVDPEDEIVDKAITESDFPSPMLIESCERVATFYNKKIILTRKRSTSHFGLLAKYQPGEHLSVNYWPEETEDSLQKFIDNSPYSSTLNFLSRLGKTLPDILPGMMTTVIEEAHQLYGFQQHIARVIRQITHKYPRVNVLGLTDPELGLTEYAISSLHDAFLSYRVAGKPEANLESRALASTTHRSRIVIEELDLDAKVSDSTQDKLYDVVLVTASVIKGQHMTSSLRKIRSLMRPGGFLVLVDVSSTPLKDRIRQVAGDFEVAESQQVVTPPDWPDVLDVCGFSQSMQNSHQYYAPGFTLVVRQANSDLKHAIHRPFSYRSDGYLTEKLLVVGGKQLWTSLISKGVSQSLAPQCGTVDTAESFEDIHPSSISTYSAVILLSDVDMPFLANLTEEQMNKFRALLRPQMSVLWVTYNALSTNPDQSASIGFARTMIAEIPDLVMQTIDLDTIDTCPAVDVISKAFAQLVIPLIHKSAAQESPLWLDEQEVYVEKGRRLIPRMLNLRESNDRVNAFRRVLDHNVNTLENIVQLEPTHTEDGLIRYETKVSKLDLQVAATQSTMQVDYSTVDVLTLGWTYSAHLCMGRDVKTGDTRVALSNIQASYVNSTSICISDLLQGISDQPKFLALVFRYLSALSIANGVGGEPVVLIEPDAMFKECAQDVFEEKGIWYRFCSTDAERCRNSNISFVHVHSSSRSIKELFPISGGSVIDFLPEGSEISEVIVDHLPKNCNYHSRDSLMSPEGIVAHGTPEITQSIWQQAITLALSKLSDSTTRAAPALIPLPQLLHVPVRPEPFQIIDWKAERTIPHTIKPSLEGQLYSPNKTYILVGLTRDFGQSLCNLFVQNGARHIVLCSRNPPKLRPKWQDEMVNKGINIRFEAMDVTKLDQVVGLKTRLAETCPPVGGLVNGAMVLEDRVFAQMSVETFHRVMHPKTVGSKNLDTVFDSPDLEFFIMTSSFAAIGGHAGQSNYAAANMFMNGLASSRRKRGLVASVLNIGVIYGLGFLHREKDELYDGLEREGYPPISERDIHHMFLEAIISGRPEHNQISDISTGFGRFDFHNPTLHWHHMAKFSHHILPETSADEAVQEAAGGAQKGKTLKELLSAAAPNKSQMMDILVAAFAKHLESTLRLAEGRVHTEDTVADLGVDSLTAVEIRNWFWKNTTKDVAVMKILGGITIGNLCAEIVDGLLASDPVQQKASKDRLDVLKVSKPAASTPSGVQRPSRGTKNASSYFVKQG